METSLPADGFTGVFSTAISLQCLGSFIQSDEGMDAGPLYSLPSHVTPSTYTSWVDFGWEDGWQAEMTHNNAQRDRLGYGSVNDLFGRQCRGSTITMYT